MGDPKYMPIKEWPQLTNLLDEALANYNDLVIIPSTISKYINKIHIEIRDQYLSRVL